MSQANVYTSVANAVWYTDKCEIVTGNTAVTYNVYVVQAGNPIVGILGSVQTASNVMLTSQASASLVNATFNTGTGVANSVTVVSVVNGASLLMSANASATSTGSYTLTTGAPGNIYSAQPSVAASNRQQIYVGAGNKLTIVGSNFTARELGTASSAVEGS
jgi:uncharacterized membrane protein YdcZ (DUF606 family)